MIIWIILNSIVTFYISIAFSSLVKNKLMEDKEKKSAIYTFFKLDLIIWYCLMAFAAAAAVVLFSTTVEEIVYYIRGDRHFSMVPDKAWLTLPYYLFICMLTSSVVINLYLREDKGSVIVPNSANT